MEEQLQQLEKYWTNRAEGYSQVNQDELAGEQKTNWFHMLTKHFPDKEPAQLKILDVGTGPGFFSIILAQAGYCVTAIDYTQQMLIEAQANAADLADQITWLQMDAQALTFEDQAFDIVVSRNITWNLDHPEKAYSEWHRVLKKGGLMLNYDANWYNYLFDEEKRKAYDLDRAQVLEQNLEDHYTCTDIDAMEAMAKKLPLSPVKRPAWDLHVLQQIGFKKIEIEEDMGHKVWSLTERINYASSPMFEVCAYK